MDKINPEERKVKLFLNIMDLEKNEYLSKLKPVSFGQVMVGKERGSIKKRMFFVELKTEKNELLQKEIGKFKETNLLKRQLWSDVPDIPLRNFKDFYLVTRNTMTIVFSPDCDQNRNFCHWEDVLMF